MSPSNDTSLRVVAALLADEAGRVLVTRRPEGKHLAGLWEFPGGKCEPGESDQDALARELTEELGISSQVLGLVAHTRHAYERFVVDLWLYEVRWTDGRLQALDAAELKWVLPEDIEPQTMPPADRPLLEAIRRHSR